MESLRDLFFVFLNRMSLLSPCNSDGLWLENLSQCEPAPRELSKNYQVKSCIIMVPV